MNKLNRKQIILDTETTGMNKLGLHYEGHNIIEIGAVEIINRQLTGMKFHTYIKPNRKIEHEAFKIHGITNEFLEQKPTFAEIVNDFLKFIENSELIIHNAPFDIGFINYELSKLKKNFIPITNICKITDTLILAKKLFPGKRNNLNALCERFNIDYSQRTLHNALLDAKLLAMVYIAMTGGQTTLDLSIRSNFKKDNNIKLNNNYLSKLNLKIIKANDEEIKEHQKILELIEKASGKKIYWN